MREEELTPWVGKLAVIDFYDGESTTAHILCVDAPRYELVIDVLDSNRPYPDRDHRAFTIRTSRILSIYDAPEYVHPRRPLPPPDSCRVRQPFSLGLFVLLTLFVFIIIIGGLFLFIMLRDLPFGIQVASLLVYTATIPLFTFGGFRGLQPYLLECPIVQRQLPRLFQRHLVFLAALFVLQTAIFRLRGHWLSTSDRGVYEAVILLCVCLAGVQVFTNRSLLNRAHLDLTPVDPAESPVSQLARHDDEQTVLLDWEQGTLAEGLACYRNQEFFLAHEHWEIAWLRFDEPEKTFLQALIQITAAFHHLQRENRAGTKSLLKTALRRLDSYPDEYGGIDVDEVRRSVRAWLKALDGSGPSPKLPFPTIR